MINDGASPQSSGEPSLEDGEDVAVADLSAAGVVEAFNIRVLGPLG